MSYNSHRRKAVDINQPLAHRASHARTCAVCVCEKFGVSRATVFDEVRKTTDVDLNAGASSTDIINAIYALDLLKLDGMDSALSENSIKKIVLISDTGYSQQYDQMLKSLIEQEYELFCVVGKDCQTWEDVMDELAIGNGSDSRYITTTCHPDESEIDVIEFANMFSVSIKSRVRIVRI